MKCRPASSRGNCCSALTVREEVSGLFSGRNLRSLFQRLGHFLAVGPICAQDLPEGELAKLDGPATISGDTLQVSVHNGTTWNIREITVGVTMCAAPRRPRPARFSAPDTSCGDDHTAFRKTTRFQPFSTT